MSVVATYAGFTFRGGQETATGFFLDDEGLVGWSDGVDGRFEDTPRPGSHGSFGTTQVFSASRTITVRGSYTGATVADAKQARLALAAIGADGFPSTFTVTDDDLGIQLSATVSRVGAPRVPEQVLIPFFTYEFTVNAPDGRRYGSAASASTGLPTSGTGMSFPFQFPAEFGTPGTSGRLTMTNAGTADTYPLLAVAGQLDAGFSVIEVETGRETRFERVVPAGSTVFVNARTGRAYIDQVQSDVSGFLTRTDYPSIPAGATRTLQFASLGSSSGSPLLTATWQSAWW